MKNYKENGTGICVHEKVIFGKHVEIGHCSYIGIGNPDDGEIIIGDNVTIGAFCLIYFGTIIKDSVEIGDYCLIGIESKIGRKTKILAGKHVSYKVSIGENCIIGGHVADRTIIEDNVTYLGEIAHSHRDPNFDWDDNEEPSPYIYKGSFIGVNALIIGDRKIGPCAYIGAGEIVRTDVCEGMALIKGEMNPLKSYRGIFKSRCNG